jgi:hypothetical protein
MDQKDRDMLIVVHEDVKHIKAALPELVRKIEKHDKFIAIASAAFVGLGAILVSVVSGFWERFLK